MPRIPQATQQVSSQGLPSGALTVRATPDAFGASAAQGAQNIGQVFNQIAAEERRKANSLMATETDRKFSELESSLLYDPENGALNRKGRNAFGSLEEVLSEYDERTGEIVGGLANDDQKAAAARMRSARRASIERTLQRHISSERQAFDQAETDAYLANSLEAAANNYNDPQRIATELDRQEGAVLAWAERNGVSDEVKNERLSALTSKTHTAVIDRMLTNGEYKGAREYFAANREDIRAEDAAAAEKLIKAQTLRGAAQETTDSILAETDNLKDALKKARAIEDPEQRDEVSRRVKSRFAEAEAIEAQERKENIETAFARVEETGSIDSVPIEVWDKLDAETKRSVEVRSRQVRMGVEPVTDWEVYYDLKTQASNPETAVAYTEENLMKYRHQLSDAEFKELVGIQKSLQAGRGRSDKILQGFRTVNQIANDTLESIGIDTSPKPGSDEAKQVLEFRRKLDSAIVAHQTQTGKEVTTEEAQRIADRLVIKGEVPGAIWGNTWRTDKFAFEVKPGESFEVTDVEDVPQEERLKIEEALRRRNIPITESAILTLFNAKVGQ